MIAKLLSIIISLGAGFLGGYVLKQYSFPAPYMLGSLSFACTISLFFRLFKNNKLNLYLEVPANLRYSALAVIGVILGSYITINSLNLALGWWISFLQVMVVSNLITFSSYFYLTKVRGKEKALAWFSSLPGGLSELSIQSRNYTKHDSAVIFYHLCRITAIFVLVPLILIFINVDGTSSVNKIVSISFNDSNIYSIIFWVIRVIALGVTGVILGMILRIPMPYMIGPLGLSIIYHLLGFEGVTRVSEPILICQTILGTSIGLRLSSIEWKLLKDNIFDGFITTAITLLIVILVSYFLSSTIFLNSSLEIEFLKYFLIFIPGGVSEISLLSIVYGYEVAFVTLHHLVRIFTVLIVTQYGIKTLRFKIKKNH